MNTESEYEKIVFAIHNSVGDRSNWKEIVESIVEFTGGISGAVAVKNRDNTGFRTRILSSKQSDNISEYRAYSRLIKTSEFIFPKEQIQVEKKRNGVFKVIPLQTDLFSAVLLIKYKSDKSTSAGLKYLCRLRRHILYALSSVCQVAEAKSEKLFLQKTMDNLSTGVMLLTDNNFVLYKNSLLVSILEERNLFYIDCTGRLKFVDKKHCLALQSTYKEVSNTPEANKTLLLANGAKSGVLLKLCGVPSLETMPSILPPVKRVLVRVHPLPAAVRPEYSTVKAWYGLTISEVKVVELLATGLTNSQIAIRRGVSPETIKTQLRSVLEKTQAANRLDLVSMVYSMNTRFI